MKTGSHLKIEQMGEKAMGIKLFGNPRKPEPESFRVHFPGGIIDLERCEDNSYWVHVIANEPSRLYDRTAGETDEQPARFVDARLHLTDKHSSEVDLGDFNSRTLYDVALRVRLEAAQ